MAQANRSTTTPSVASDDPVENLTEWFQVNSKLIMIAAAAVVIVGGGIVGYRYLSAAKTQEASLALYQAQVPLLDGKLPEAQQALQRVSSKYGGTAAGQQATMLLAQVLFDEKQFQGGITALENAMGNASSDAKPSFYSLIASGYEGLAKLDQAAEAYGKAADASSFSQEKAQYHASQARSLMAAGKMADAKKIWGSLATDETSAFGQEAKIRLGEIAGALGTN